MANYLQRLNARLAAGLARLPAEVRQRHVDFLLTRQNADGGFSGREGGSDLYYTSFALRGLLVLDGLSPALAEKAAGFLRASLTQHASAVDFFSLLFACLIVQTAGGPDVLADCPADWPERVAAMLETFRKADGGYAKTPDGTSSSTYHSFLVGLCYQLLGRRFPDLDRVVKFVHSRLREDGGFVEIAPMRRSGANPTAAAVGILQLAGEEGAADAWLPGMKEGVIGFLAEMPSEEGGLRANARVPLADLLSTFTGSWTLDQLGAGERIDRPAIQDYALSLEQAAGGFRGGLWDDRTDVEYTFYGLGTLALCSTQR